LVEKCEERFCRSDTIPGVSDGRQTRCCSKERATPCVAQVKKTRNSAIAHKPARRVYRSVKVNKHSIIPFLRYSFLLCNSNFVFKTRRFYDIRLQKCRDLEIRVRGHSRSLKVVPFYRFGVVSYRNSVCKLHGI